jgi:hypothetical protein
MKPLVVIASFLAGACAPGIVSAAVPDPGHCTVPAYIDLVGSNDGVPDPAGLIVITVRDAVNNPIAGADVELNFQNCSDSRLSMFQSATLDCNNRALHATTNVVGQAFFVAMGAANVASPPVPPAIAPGSGAGCARCFADGIQIGVMTVGTPDINGAIVGDGVNGIDFEVLRADIGAIGLGAPYRGRSDLNHDGSVNAADLSILLVRYISPGGSCDPQAVPYGTGFCP